MFTFILPGFFDNVHKYFQGLISWYEEKIQLELFIFLQSFTI